jgi:hypothetical protein
MDKLKGRARQTADVPAGGTTSNLIIQQGQTHRLLRNPFSGDRSIDT